MNIFLKETSSQRQKRFLDEMYKLIRKRGHVFVNGIYENKNSPLTILCPAHNKQNKTTYTKYRKSKTGMYCCGHNLKRQANTSLFDKMVAFTKRKACERDHKYIDGTYINKHSLLIISCNKHSFTYKTTYFNYLRSVKGLPCCKSEMLSKKARGRILVNLSPEMIKKRSAALRNYNEKRKYKDNIKNSKKLGTGQKWRSASGQAQNNKRIREYWKNQCAITGSDRGRMVIHHYYSGSRNKTNKAAVEQHLNFRSNPMAAILISEKLHKVFHTMFGYEQTNIDMFIEFLNYLVDCPESNIDCWAGTETSLKDMNRLKNLIKLVKQVKQTLIQL